LVRYLFEKELAGQGAEMSQYQIAAECFGISDNYDADQNSLVRVHVSRLRRVLRDYYEGPGADDEVQVRLPAGSYQFQFEKKIQLLRFEPAVRPEPVVGLLEFRGLGLDDYWRHLPMALVEELSLVMPRQGRVKILGPFLRRLLEAEGLDPVQLGYKHAVDFILDGSVERTETTLVVRTRLLDGPSGMQIWAGREELDLERPDVAGFEEILMRRLSASLGEDGGIITRHLSSLARVKPENMLTVYEAVLLGRMYLADYDHEALPRVLKTLRRAVQQVPQEPAPHATLAVLLAMLGMEPQWLGDPPVDEIHEHAKLAMTLSPADGWSVLAQACAAALHQDRKELERIGRSLGSEGFDSPAMLLGGVGTLMCCQKAGAGLGVELIRQAIAANPHYMKIFHIGLALVSFEAGDFEAVRRELDAFQFRWGLSDPLLRGAIAGLEGDFETAGSEWQRVLESFPDFVTDGERSLGYLWHADYIALIGEGYQRAGISIRGE
jgi:TolB-like protein